MKMNLNEDRSEITRSAIVKMGLKVKGSLSSEEVSIHCPFHKDKTPSMYINVRQGVYHCFSCGKSGNIEGLYRDITGESLNKALGIKTDPFSSFARTSKIDYSYLDRVDLSMKPVYINMDSSDLHSIFEVPDAIKYLRKRGIHLDIAESMGMKFAFDTRINTTRFQNRIIIPIYEDGKLVSVEGRRIYPTDDVKVLYPLHGSVNLLYDIDNLDKNDTLYGCEGLMDLAVLRSCPYFKNSTSIFGANLTKRQISQISQFKKFVYINDNDMAGEKTVESLKNSGLDNVYNLKLPETICGNKIKDIGDLPGIGLTVKDLMDRKWLSYIRKL